MLVSIRLTGLMLTIDSRSLDKVATKVASRLGVPFLGLQMFHVRPGGIEAPLWDSESSLVVSL